MNTYSVTLRYEDRKVGSEGRTIKVDASSIAGAIGKATREFVKSLDRKQRFDMNKGLKIEALGSPPTNHPSPKQQPKPAPDLRAREARRVRKSQHVRTK